MPLKIAQRGQIPPFIAMDVLRAEAEVSKRDQDLTVARTNLQLPATLMKNAITNSLDDPVLESIPVVPTDPFNNGGYRRRYTVVAL